MSATVAAKRSCDAVVNQVRTGSKRSMVTGCHRNAPIVGKVESSGRGRRREKKTASDTRLSESQVGIVFIIISYYYSLITFIPVTHSLLAFCCFYD